MPKYIAIHPLAEPTPPQEAGPIAKHVKSLCNKDCYWVSSWVQLDETGNAVKTFCEWDAKDMQTVSAMMKELEKAGLPLEGVYPMMKMEPEDYR